ncbi:hypothetical protein PPTG_21478 [Phytophthora nicotianae INRA-310]|uniref:Uncharacterized protein n=1 Tax=Phytophthora nicotianae (strain INRA-310) TaxID=761204 RepID=W2R512_PHYN3|nr:hypothetical protein PPTG_21478 [Phytophthora nicotianae INRA-310]ETN19625.1 hypothetical protein PPTG_21478 [Phytophthora nicotianae INRA-310]
MDEPQFKQQAAHKPAVVVVAIAVSARLDCCRDANVIAAQQLLEHEDTGPDATASVATVEFSQLSVTILGLGMWMRAST